LSKKILLSSLLCFSLFTLFSCSNPTNDNLNLEQNNAQISSFEPASLNNSLLGSFNNTAIFLSSNNVEKAFKSEKDAINYILQKQDTIFLQNKPYAVIEKSGLFYVYEINSKNTKLELKSYSDLRDITINKKSDIKLNSIVSQKGNIRFYSYDSSFTPSSKATQPSEIVNKLKIMETTFTPKKDSRGVFVAEYRVISQRVEKEINIAKEKGQTKAANFLQSLMTNFANKYFSAYDTYFSENLDKTPEVWRMAFDSGRKSDIVGIDKSFNIPEIISLSMNAHIIHDLSLSLKEINYNPKDQELKQVFMKFNSVLFEEKNNILNAIDKIYGKNVVSAANNFFGSVGDFTMQKIFNLMRNTAENQSEFSDKNKIIKKAISLGDSMMSTIPGGNSIKK
jgi:hypothetical protein